MADDPHNTSDISDLAEPIAANEDAETTAARRELKQTTISEKAGQDDKSASDDDAPKPKATLSRITPEINLSAAKQDVLKEQISSPKKKRAHDELDENRDVAEAPLEEGAPDQSASTTATQSRTQRSEPEKKRPRDRQASASAVRSGKEEVEPLSASASPRSSMEQPSEAKDSTGSTAATTDKPKTSATSFASSGFAKLASSSSSPFGAFGGAGKPSLFGSASGSSSFGSALSGSKPAAPAAPPKLSFGSGPVASPFAGLNGQQSSSSVFKSSAFGGGGFGGSALSGARLSNFGQPGGALKSKPAKPFGAPDSDEEKSDEVDQEDEDTKGDGASDDGESKEEEREDSKGADDKKKTKLHKIVVDDGEGREITIFSVRSKMYVMEKGVGWKERGGGMLKVNVPRSTVEIDDHGVPDPSSFDPSELDDDEEDEGRKHVRLIMRQDHTLRVILNTVILPAMTFQVTHKLKSATVLFTAFEAGEAIQVQMKLSEANATAFSHLVEMLKKQLADV